MEKDIESLIEEASNLLVKASTENQKEPTEFFKKLENILAEAEKSKNKSSFKKVLRKIGKRDALVHSRTNLKEMRFSVT